MGVGVLGDEARVVGGDAAEPMCSSRGHLEEAADRISHQCVTLRVRKIYIFIIYIYLHPELKSCTAFQCRPAESSKKPATIQFTRRKKTKT